MMLIFKEQRCSSFTSHMYKCLNINLNKISPGKQLKPLKVIVLTFDVSIHMCVYLYPALFQKAFKAFIDEY